MQQVVELLPWLRLSSGSASATTQNSYLSRSGGVVRGPMLARITRGCEAVRTGRAATHCIRFPASGLGRTVESHLWGVAPHFLRRRGAGMAPPAKGWLRWERRD